jgi:hypothetical protein
MDEFWGPDWPYGPLQPPATDADIRAWEGRFGVQLPPALAAALRVQNGGTVRGTNVLIRPLSEIEPLAIERWAHLWEYSANQAFGDPARLVLFGEYDEFPGSFVLNYNAGPVPRVIVLCHDVGDELRDEDDGSFDELIRQARARGRAGPESPDTA